MKPGKKTRPAQKRPRKDPSAGLTVVEAGKKYDYDIDLSDENRSHTKLLNLLRPKQQVLEIGCATGYMTRFMTAVLNCRVVAVEVDKAAARKAEAFCERLIIGDVETLAFDNQLPGQQFDVILMADVVEHLKDPQALLRRLKPRLRDTGYLLMSVPNGAHGSLALDVLDGRWQYRDTGLLDRTHLHFFDKDSLAAFLEPVGFFIAQLDRTIVHPRDTEMKTPWDSYPREVTAYLEKVNPEYQTYQFVIKAHPMSAAGWRKGLEDALAAERATVAKLSETLKKVETDLQYYQGEYNGFEAELNKREKEYLANLEKELARIEDEKGEIHQGYQAQIRKHDEDMAALHTSYSTKMDEAESAANARIKQIHRDYQSHIGHVEAEMAQVHIGYKQELEKTIRRERKLYHTVQVIQRDVDRLQAENGQLERLHRDRQYELDTIRNSLAWRVMARYRRSVDRWLPQDTRRRRFYRLSMLAPVVLVKEGPVSFGKKILRRCLPWQKPVPPASDQGAGASSFPPLAFPPHDTVRVSIVIPVFNQAAHTYRCLSSLLHHTRIAAEIIVVDNASSDGTASMLASMSGIRVITNEENLGFVQACNQGAADVRGEYLLLLNNDTEVTDGWLDALLAPFEQPGVGVVGARLVYPDGRLQEAGNIIWQDGSGWNYGRGDDPQLPAYNYRREVDYCSGACLMISRNLWQAVGGFDNRFAPAYYEDTDLCFAVRERGYRVVYQPASRVIHHEGITAGTDILTGFKRYQAVNHQKFIQKWGVVLGTRHYEGPSHLYLARERGGKKRAMVVDHYAPQFDKDSGSLRMFSLIAILQQLDYKVVFWPDNRAFDPRYTTSLQQMGVEAMYGDIHFDRYMKEHGRHFDLILLSRPHVADNYIDAARAYSDAMLIYDTVDLHCLREARRALLETDEACRLAAETCAQDWRERELDLARTADVTLVVSPVEKELLEKEEDLKGKIEVVSNVHTAQDISTRFEDRKDLMFIGGFMHQPNEDGIVWFVQSIFPKIRAQLPGVHLYVVGSHPTEKVKALAGEGVTVTGYVDDVSSYFEQSRVFVSPLRYGAGVKGKIGQSLSFGLPVVTTPIGAEGMGILDGANALVAADETTFAEKVVRLYQDKTLWERISANGLQTIREKFSPDVTRRTLQRLLDKFEDGNP